jgi:hypothetical protein
MRGYGPAFIGVAAVTAAVVGLSGCGSESKDTINYGSFGTTADVDCADGNSLNVGGSKNTLTVKGTCANVNIGGSDNKITFEKVDKEITVVTVVGENNTITCKAGDANVTAFGDGSSINC